MAVSSPAGRRWTVAALLALTFVTGLVDAVSYLRLGRVFVANMTGNVVFLGFSAYPHSGLYAVSSIVAIGGFVVGALGGGRFASAFDHQPRRWLTGAFGAQSSVLAVIALLVGVGALPFGGDRNAALPLIALLAVALGLQNSTVRRLGEPDLTTTVLTLTLTGLSADSALAGGPGSRPHRRLGSVAAMLAGAAAGAALVRVTVGGVIAIAALLVAIVTAIFWMAGPE